LYASPLLASVPPGKPLNRVPMAALNVTDERNLLQEALRRGRDDAPGKHGDAPHVRCGLATANGQSIIKALQHLSVDGIESSALHLALHGYMGEDGNQLLLEDAAGDGQWMDEQRLRLILGVAGQKNCQALRFCFLNSCYSESFGQEFIRAGCPYVICSKSCKSVLDFTARRFSESFYNRLGAGLSVPDAFRIAKDSLVASGDKKLCEEADHFTLLERLSQAEGRRRSVAMSADTGAADMTKSCELTRSSTMGSIMRLVRTRSRTSASNRSMSPESQIVRTSTVPEINTEVVQDKKQPSLQRQDSGRLLGVGYLLKEASHPGLEDFIGRSLELVYLLGHFKNGRRCACIYGPAEIGKTSLLKKLVQFASLAGRTFADAAFYVDCVDNEHKSCDDLGAAIEAAVRSLQSCFSPKRNTNAEGTVGYVENAPSHLASLLQKLHELYHHRGGQHRVLLAFDGLIESESHKNDLEALLRHCPWLYVLTAARHAWKEDLMGFKVVPMELGGLDARSAADLLARRARREFTEADLRNEHHAEVSETSEKKNFQALPRSPELLKQLAKHPVLVKTNGCPGRVRRLAELVTPELRSLYDLISLGA